VAVNQTELETVEPLLDDAMTERGEAVLDD
jgi:hypothetical protein